MEKLLEILKEINGEIDYTKEKALITNGLFESFEIIMCVEACEDTFGIEIQPEDIVQANFESADAIWHLVEKYL